MTNKKIGFYFESSLPVIPSNDDFAFYYIKNEQQINGENKNIPDVYLYNKSLNQYFQINKPHNLDLRTINSLPILDNNIDLGLNDILNFNNETDIPLNLNGNLLYSKLNSLFFTNRNIPTDENVLNSIIFGTNFGNQEVIVKSNNDIYFGNNINISNPSMSNIVIGNDIELQNQTIDFNNNIFIGGSYDFETESIYYGKIATPAVPKIENNIFIKNLGFGNTQHFFKFVAPLVLSDNTKIIDNDNNNENDSLLYDNILVAKNNGLIGIKRMNSFDFIPTLSQVLTKSGNPNTVTVENINVENLKFNNYENNESISLDNKIGYLIIDNTGKILWKELENKPTLESVILENPIVNTKPIFNEVEISNKLYVKNLTNKNNDILFDKLIITNSNGELAQISKNDLLSEKHNTLTTAVTSTTTVGAINAGDTIPAGTTIQELAELLLRKIFYPTYSNHSFSLTSNAGSSPKEVGSSFDITLTFNFNRGEILGNWVGNIWVETATQADKLGAATSYSINGSSSNPATMAVTVSPGTNILEGTVSYGLGAQPKDSKGDDFGSRFPAGISPTQSTSFKGVYPFFYYKSTSPITPEIMQSAIANGQATKVIEDSTGTITVPFLPNGEYIAVAYPATSKTKAIWFINAFDSGEIPGGVLGSVRELPCSSPDNLWNNIPFKIHVSPGLLTQENAVQLKNP